MTRFNKLQQEYYHAWFRYHPEAAVDIGIEGYADQLMPYGDDEIGALIVLQEKLISGLDEIALDDLTESQCIDLEVMRGAALLEMKELIERDWRRRDPTRFLPINAIYQLQLRPVKDLHGALHGRLTAIPGYLRGARAQLSREPAQIPTVWLELALEEARGGIDYFHSLRQHPMFSRFKLEKALDDASQALNDFVHFLQRSIAPHTQGEFACGREHFEQLLRHRHFLDLGANRLHELGQKLFDETLTALREVTQELSGNDDIAALTAKIQAKRPQAGQLLTHYSNAMQDAKVFVEQHDLVSIPPQEQLKIVETPVFLRHQIPFAAYLDPSPRDPKQQGFYYVTPVQDTQDLGEHNVISLHHTSVHEAWPGHHLQFVTANLHVESCSLPRLLNPSATMYEGWALYCEQLMVEEGFLAAPESRFVLLKDRLWRALRVLLDVELHTRGLSLQDAASRMQDLLGFTRKQALADLNWYSQSPTVPMGYAVGWLLITATRARLRAMEPTFSLRGFHDRLLSAGSIALPLVLRSCFGEPLWNSIQRTVLNPS